MTTLEPLSCGERPRWCFDKRSICFSPNTQHLQSFFNSDSSAHPSATKRSESVTAQTRCNLLKSEKGAAITIILHIPTRTPPLNELISVCGQSPSILTHLFLFHSLGKKAYHMAIIWNRWHLPNGEAHCLSLQFRALHFRSETAILLNNYLPGQRLQLVESQRC